MKVVLMAGGRGTRISELFPDIPKPLIPIQNMPVLEREIISLREQGFTEIILTVGYMADKIKDYFGDGSKLGVKINYFVEDKPLGNAGALFFLDLKEDFLLLNADAVFDVDFNRMVKYHRRKGALVTLFTHPNSHPYDSGLIIADKSGEVKQWLTKEESRPQYYKNRVNAGLHVISPKALEMSATIMKQHNPSLSDPQLRQLIAAHIDDDSFCRYVIQQDINKIALDLREAHKDDFFSVPEDNPLEDFLQTAEETASPDSDPEQAALAFICKRLKLNLKKLSEDEKKWLKKIAQKSDLLKNPNPQRGRK